jgi:beta-glucosidase
VPAILDIWYPGTQGGAAVANLLFGDAVLGGKLPFTWPPTVGHIPMIYAHTNSHEPQQQERRYWDEASTPLFPFGHGLSYGSFAYTGLRLDRERIAAGETLTVAVEVTNTGARSGDEVVQLYVRQRHGCVARPVRELKGFRRVTIEDGETHTVEFRLGPDKLRYWHPLEHTWVIDAASFDVWVGGDATAALGATFERTIA